MIEARSGSVAVGRQVEQDLALLKVNRHPLERAQLGHAQQQRGLFAKVEAFERRRIGKDHRQFGEVEAADRHPMGKQQIGGNLLSGH